MPDSGKPPVTELLSTPSASAGTAPATRRRFLTVASAVSAVLAAVAVGAPSLRALLSPVFKQPAKKDWIKVAQADQIDIATPVKVDFTETINDAWVETRALRTVWLTTEDGEKFTAFSGTCTHLGCAFGVDTERKLFHCPCHHGLFDLKTGAVLGGPPPRPLDPLPVRVVNGEVQIIHKQFRSGIPERIEV
jgi:menaquinol-cytochrome c reductase iron-sulfur subunit